MTEIQPQKSGSIFDVKWNDAGELPTVKEYRTLCVPSLLSLLFGLLTPLVLAHWGFVFIPILALVLAFFALNLIARSDGMQFGKPFAWAAIFLSLGFITSYFSLWEAYKGRVIREAVVFGGSYFELLARAENDPALDILSIRDMQSPYWQRSAAPLEERWKALEKDMFSQEEMSSFAEDRLLRTLMALGDKAKVTFYKVKSYANDPGHNNDYVTLVYAVTYENDTGEKETFFIDLNVKRFCGEDATSVANQKKKMAGWGVQGMKGPVLPKEFERKEPVSQEEVVVMESF